MSIINQITSHKKNVFNVLLLLTALSFNNIYYNEHTTWFKFIVLILFLKNGLFTDAPVSFFQTNKKRKSRVRCICPCNQAVSYVLVYLFTFST
jgi:hypothetical protein